MSAAQEKRTARERLAQHNTKDRRSLGPKGLTHIKVHSLPVEAGVGSGEQTPPDTSNWEATNMLNFMPTAERTEDGKIVVLLVPEPLYSAQLAEVIRHREAVEKGKVLPTQQVFRRPQS